MPRFYATSGVGPQSRYPTGARRSEFRAPGPAILPDAAGATRALPPNACRERLKGASHGLGAQSESDPRRHFMMNNAKLAAAFFSDTGDAKKSIEALRQGGFAQIGVAARDQKRAGKIAEHEQVREGVPVSPDAGSELRESMGESDYSDSGDLHGTLTTAGFSDDQAAHFEKCMAEKDGVLVSVQAPSDRWTEARRVLEAAGGDLGPVSEAAMASGPASTPRPMPATAPMSEGQRIQLRGELLRVHTDRVQRGEARIYKETVTEPQTVEVPVTREELVVEHHPAAAGTPAAG